MSAPYLDPTSLPRPVDTDITMSKKVIPKENLYSLSMGSLISGTDGAIKSDILLSKATASLPWTLLAMVKQ
ncbi:hypothetical protein BGZ94_004582 [Podila epigama]|nr:hypothetical protein BGZ94_004582 [Podila epigama]